MKKILWLMAALMCTVCAFGCSKDEEPQSEKQILAINESSGEDITDGAEPFLKAADDNNNGGMTSAADGAGDEVQTNTQTNSQNTQNVQKGQNGLGIGTYPSITVPNSSQQSGTVPTIQNDATQPAEGIFGAQGKTESEWLAAAQELYKEGCDVAFRYLCTGSEFPFDMENLEIIDKTYFLTTCNSFEEATEPYYQLFSREYHGNDFDGLLLVQNGRLYAARSARGMDMTYLSSEVKKLVSVSDTEIVFSVLVEYEDSETTAEFTLVPEDGMWKIGKFTLPY